MCDSRIGRSQATCSPRSRSLTTGSGTLLCTTAWLKPLSDLDGLERRWRDLLGSMRLLTVPRNYQRGDTSKAGGRKRASSREPGTDVLAKSASITTAWRALHAGLILRRSTGVRGREFIEVHHLKPIASVEGEYDIDPKADLRPVCSNCHRMIHRGDDILRIEELREMITAT